MTQRDHEVLVIGSGPAGLTAAIYAARANLQPTCVEGFNAGGLIAGGQLMFTTEVENFPSYPEPIRGDELMGRMRAQAVHQGVQFISEDVTRVDLSTRPFRVWVGEDSNTEHTTKALILATGARANYLGLPSEARLKNRGVSACAVCDGALYRGRDVVVVGGGDTAMEETNYLSKLANHVTLVHRRNAFRASKAMQARVAKDTRTTIVLDHVVSEVLGEDDVRGVRLSHVGTGEERVVECAAMFVAIGHTPMTDLFRGQLALDSAGYIALERAGTTATSVEGVFAAGDVADKRYRQAITAAGTGCMAALDAERWLAEQ
jgi:thioredoxin reductase (NADPH)